jgi:hypothetical protein
MDWYAEEFSPLRLFLHINTPCCFRFGDFPSNRPLDPQGLMDLMFDRCPLGICHRCVSLEPHQPAPFLRFTDGSKEHGVDFWVPCGDADALFILAFPPVLQVQRTRRLSG